jgi:hypothetical protein
MIGPLLLMALFAVLAAAGLVFFHYSEEFKRARDAAKRGSQIANTVSALSNTPNIILISPGTYSPTSAVSMERSRGSKVVLWPVENGAHFGWWAAEKIAPSMLVRAT